MIPPKRAAGLETIFYDGHCGLCHGFVKFVLAHDHNEGSQQFRFAPLQGETFAKTVPEEVRRALPDSVIVKTADGRLLTRSAGALHVAARLGGIWRLLAAMASVVPPFLRDLVYDGVAKVRRRLFKPPADVCPLLPAPLRARFDP